MLGTPDRDVPDAFRTGRFRLHHPVLVVGVGNGARPRGGVPDLAQPLFDVVVPLLVRGKQRYDPAWTRGESVQLMPSTTRTMAGTGRHSSTADAAAARTGSTVAVVDLHATTWQAEVSRSPRPRLWR
ncbi:hypothetical protein ADK41_06805 [Streptomyces caelestis]|uniref:Uncharacterized protein n=1 Tax=Streptomyces caelestis TaxID=36816 RepID=A0A0M9XA73_9ACTN|nr:hypothetical protein ADK41_06805 [Streptomyces caelestis]